MGVLLKLLAQIDGYKTYISIVIAALFTVIEFLIKGDYSAGAWVALGGSTSIAAVVASLRHAIDKPRTTVTVAPAVTSTSAVLILFLMLTGNSFAQTTTTPISSILDKLNFHEAIGYDIASGNVTSYTSADLLDWNNFSISAGYSTSAAIVASADYDIGGLSKLGLTVPLLSVVDLRVGFMVGLANISSATTSGTAERNKISYGPEITIVSTKF